MHTPNIEEFVAQKTIGKNKYQINKLNGWDAWDGWTLILKTIAPVMGEVIDSKNVDEEAAMFEKQNTFREILTIVSGNIHTPEIRILVEQMLLGATRNGEALDVNKDFMGKVHEMMELIVFAMEVNFKGFFTESDMFPSLMNGLKGVMTATEG